MPGEHKGGARCIGPRNDSDLQVGEGQAGIGGADARIIPFRDLAEKNVGVNIARQLQYFRAVWEL